MPIPNYDQIRYALLKYASDGQIHDFSTTVEDLATQFNLSDEERQSLIPSGKDYHFRYKTRWAKTELQKALLFEAKNIGEYVITERGKIYLKSVNGNVISRPDLMGFPEFVEYFKPSRQETPVSVANVSELIETDATPEELVDLNYQLFYNNIKDELLERVLSVTPAFFERLVVDLLLAMGYGSSLDSGEPIGKSGDGGVDGIIREDKLGLSMIYIQAKRYARNNGVGRPAIQAFVGSLMGMSAIKGVFITTSYFSEQAIQYAKNVPNVKVILIDGQQLATLMIEHNVGVSVQKTYEIKQVDENYFPDA